MSQVARLNNANLAKMGFEGGAQPVKFKLEQDKLSEASAFTSVSRAPRAQLNRSGLDTFNTIQSDRRRDLSADYNSN